MLKRQADSNGAIPTDRLDARSRLAGRQKYLSWFPVDGETNRTHIAVAFMFEGMLIHCRPAR